jgi:antitoxin YefM
MRAARTVAPCGEQPDGWPLRRLDRLGAEASYRRRPSRRRAAPFLVILVTMTTMLPLGEVKAHLSELVSRVQDHHERVTVTVHGRPSAMLVAVEDIERLEETIAILSDPATMRRLAESDAELARGEVVSAEELAAAMRQRRSSTE